MQTIILDHPTHKYELIRFFTLHRGGYRIFTDKGSPDTIA